MGYIYALHLGDRNWRYVGQTVDLNKRLAALTDPGAPNSKGPLLRQWIERNINRIEMSVLGQCTDAEMNGQEIEWIKYFRDHGYALLNVQPGGRKERTFWKRYPVAMRDLLASWEDCEGKKKPDDEDVIFLNALITKAESLPRHKRKKKRKKRR